MERQYFRLSARPFALLVSAATVFAALSVFPSPTIASAATSTYLGAVVAGRGTTLGSASYTPPSGALYVDADNGSDTNTGTLTSPVKTVARGLVLTPAGGTVILRAGTYHESVTVTKQITIQNYPREVAWFDGSTPVPAWTPSGSVWTAPWTTFFSPSTFSGVNPAYPYANYPAQVFVDDTQLQEVGSAGAVTTGKFFADSANKRLVIGTDPTSHTVASSDLQRAIQIGTTNVNLKGFGVRRYATTSTARAAVLMDPDGGTFENLVVSDNAAEGLALSGANKTIRNLTVERNGMMGLGMDRANNASITNSVVRYNNSEHFPTQPVASGIKITRAANARISNNLISDSYEASGLWLDEYCSDVVITDNTIINNGELQLNMEASSRLIIANNTVTGGRKGIEIRDTDNARIFNNHITGYTLIGIFLAQDERWTNPSLTISGFKLLVKTVTIANNVIGCGSRFEIFGKDGSTNIPMDQFGMTITGNVFSPSQKSPELNMVGWGLSDNLNVAFIQTPTALQAKNSTWQNLQSTTCTTNPETTIPAATLTATATPLPADIAQATGATTGTRTIGLINTSATPTPTPPSAQPTAPSPANSVLAGDGFGRTVAGAWGSADTGGAWSVVGGSSAFSVASGRGMIALSPSWSREARLNGVSSTTTVSEVEMSSDEVPAGASPHLTVIGRQVGSDYYGARARLEVGGAIRLYILRNETALASSYVMPSTTYAAGDVLHVKVQVTGTSPTTVKAKFWRDGASEPAAWTLSATDSTSALQAAGFVAFKAVVGASSTNATTHFRVDNYRVTAG